MADEGRTRDDGEPPEDAVAMDAEDALDAPEDAEPSTTGIPQDMVRLLHETADLGPPVELTQGPDGATYLVGGRPFAGAAGLVFEAQLGPDIAAAALRTPDVTVSARGAGWIRLEPATIDDHAADRVVAWFEMARRIAIGRVARPPGSGSTRH